MTGINSSACSHSQEFKGNASKSNSSDFTNTPINNHGNEYLNAHICTKIDQKARIEDRLRQRLTPSTSGQQKVVGQSCLSCICELHGDKVEFTPPKINFSNVNACQKK